MSDTLTYPGQPLLIQAQQQVARIESLDFSQGHTLAELLRGACQAGLSFHQHADATTTFFLLVDKLLVSAHDVSRLPMSWLQQMLTSTEEFWSARIDLLDPELQLEVWEIVDRLYRCWAVKRQDQESQRRIETLLDELPVPALHSALLLLTIFLPAHSGTGLHVRCAQLVETYSTHPKPLLLVSRLRNRLWFGFAETCQKYSGRDLKALQELWAFHEHLTATFGGNLVAYKLGFFGGDKKVEAAEQGAQLAGQLVEACYFVPSDPWVNQFTAFLKARIHAGTNDVKGARKELKKLVAAGFAMEDCGAFLAFIHNFLKDQDDARQTIEQLAVTVPLLRGDVSPTSMLGEIYVEAGGNPSSLGLSQPPPTTVAQAEHNLKRLQNDTLPKLTKRRVLAVESFWSAREAAFQRYVAKVIKAEHYDAALEAGDPHLMMQLDQEEAVLCAVDELPALSVIDRAVLLAATDRPIAAQLVASEIIKYLYSLAARGQTFAELVRNFPEFGRSWAVGWAYLQPYLQAGKIAEALEILDLLEALPDIPDKTLAQLFSRAAPTLLDHSSYLNTLQRGRRWLVRFHDPSAKRLVWQDLVQYGLAKLGDTAAAGAWPTICELLTDPGDPVTEQALLAWLAIQTDRTTEVEQVLKSGEVLARRLHAQLADAARRLTAVEMVKQLDPQNLRATQAMFSRLLSMGGTDQQIVQQITQFFVEQLAAGSADPGKVALGEWLLPQISYPEYQEQVRLVTRDLLIACLTEEQDQVCAQSTIEQLLRLAAHDPHTHDSLATWFECWQPSGPSTLATHAAMGEWLLDKLSSTPAERVRRKTYQDLDELQRAAGSRSERIGYLQRLTTLCPEDQSLATQLSQTRKERLVMQVKIGGIISAGLLLLVIVLRLFSN